MCETSLIQVSLFAELFNEMLMRDFGFRIYKSLLALPEKPKEDKKKDKDHKVQLVFASILIKFECVCV